MKKLALAAVAIVGLVGCGGAGAPMDRQGAGMMSAKGMGADPAATFAPLEVGADYASYVKFNTSPVVSETHGGRLVDTYVNAVGAAAYLDEEAELPVGAVIVKTSTERDGAPGPIFVMEKRAPGFDPEHGDWAYAIHWAAPPAAWAKKLGGPIYWRSPSPRVGYCVECHDNYDRNLGGIPSDQRIGALPE